MFTQFIIAPQKISPGSFLVLNSPAIEERINAGMTLTDLHSEMVYFISEAQSEQSCSYRTLLRYARMLKEGKVGSVQSTEAREIRMMADQDTLI